MGVGCLDTTTEVIPESSALPVKPTENISEQSFCPVTRVTVSEPPVLPREAIPASHVVPTEFVLASHVMLPESSPASRTMPTELIPELLVLPVMASEATLKQPTVTGSSMDDTEAIPEQPALTATGSESAPVLQTLDSVFESTSVPDSTLPSRFTPELFPILDSAPVPESLESALECASVSDLALLPEFTLELAPALEPPKSILGSVLESISGPVPVQKQPECIQEPLPSESSTLSVSLIIGREAVPCLAPKSSELPTFSISGFMASELTPKPILSPEPVPNAKDIPAPQAADSTLSYSTIFKQPLFKPVNTPRYTIYVSPTPPSMQPNTCGFPTPPAAFHSALPGYNTGFIPTLPTPSPVLRGCYGSAMPAPFKPTQLASP
ncbi:hypothetical protein G5714_016480 [Onychostoma macrolepis]|uniref:Uncharacterized protein n=1 Tax=Onychostoma macrolepis TaxID=369639 RepID=A0A7J6C8G1_9TELE|nr:hypothetical protein G5714_016480 [Onychostoma macrolepis]